MRKTLVILLCLAAIVAAQGVDQDPGFWNALNKYDKFIAKKAGEDSAYFPDMVNEKAWSNLYLKYDQMTIVATVTPFTDSTAAADSMVFRVLLEQSDVNDSSKTFEIGRLWWKADTSAASQTITAAGRYYALVTDTNSVKMNYFRLMIDPGADHGATEGAGIKFEVYGRKE